MAMIPRTSVLHGSKSIIETVARSNWTLGYTIDAVHVHSFPLSNAVPVDASAVGLEIVVDYDCNILETVSAYYMSFEAIIRTSPQHAWIHGPG